MNCIGLCARRNLVDGTAFDSIDGSPQHNRSLLSVPLYATTPPGTALHRLPPRAYCAACTVQQ